MPSARESANSLLPREQPRSEVIINAQNENRPDWVRIYEETNEYIRQMKDQSYFMFNT